MERIRTAMEIERIKAQRLYVTLMLWTGATALWCLVVVTVGSHVHLPFGPVVVFLVLCGISAALYRVFRKAFNPWAISALLAPVLVILALMLVAFAN